MAAAPPGAAGAGPGAGTGEPLLRVRDLEVRYGGGVRALHGVSLALPPGGLVAVLGANGAGKSTLLRAISGTLAFCGGSVRAGSVELDGRPLHRMNPAAIVRAGVVQVPEGRRILTRLTVEENLRVAGLALPRADRRTAQEHVEELFPVLRERARQRAGLLSGGEQQLLAIGRALMSRPRVLLLDEPSLGLAPVMVERIGTVIADIHRQGTAILLVEQNAALALRLAEEAYVFEVGRVALRAPARTLAGDQVRDRYLGGDRSAAAPALARTTAAPAPGADLVVDDLSLRFGGVAALSGVSLTVPAGTVHALIGPNGAGKSSCLDVLTGVYRADAGSARYGDAELTRLRADRIARLGVSRTFQNLALSATATVAQNLLLGRHRLGRAGFLTAGLGLSAGRREQAGHEARVAELAELLDLTEVLDDPVGGLPYGVRKRVELGRALAAEPTLLLLDEPAAGMTAEETGRMAGALARVRAGTGVTVLLVEHDMAFVADVAQTVTVLDFGRRIAGGTPAQVRTDPEVVRAYLGGVPDEVPDQAADEVAR